MFKLPIATAKKFQRDENGGIAILFGLSTVAMCMFAGLAIDLGRTYSSQQKIGAAIDAATLAAVKGMRLEGLSDTDAVTLARRIFDENMRHGGTGHWTDVHSVNITVDRATYTANVVVNATVKTTFGSIAGVQRMGAPGAAQAKFESRDVEVSLQLDLTGSMCHNNIGPCTNDRKIAALKTATTALVDILLPAPSGQAIRIALAPFNAGVNLGVYQSAVTGGITTADGCVYERKDEANQATDNFPSGNDRYMVRADLQAAPHNVANPRPCPTASVLPLTSDQADLTSKINSYVARDSTAGHLGTAWAWNMLSPNFATVWPSQSRPAAYGDADKNVILMTDGMYNTKNGKNGNPNLISGIAVDTCAAMKAQGIRVYTVGFELTDPLAIDTLAACASQPADAFRAENEQQLRDAFSNIAQNIARLRLTN